MSEEEQQKLGKTLWKIADNLRGSMNADDFRDYMLSFLFLRYLSGNYEESAKKELGADYPQVSNSETNTPLALWYERRRKRFVFNVAKRLLQSSMQFIALRSC
jgi:type I restriction enzyme M protein